MKKEDKGNIDPKIIDELIKGYRNPEDLLGVNGDVKPRKDGAYVVKI